MALKNYTLIKRLVSNRGETIDTRLLSDFYGSRTTTYPKALDTAPFVIIHDKDAIMGAGFKASAKAVVTLDPNHASVVAIREEAKAARERELAKAEANAALRRELAANLPAAVTEALPRITSTVPLLENNAQQHRAVGMVGQGYNYAQTLGWTVVLKETKSQLAVL